MKNTLLFMVAALFIISCNRAPSFEEETPDNAFWFSKFKSQEQYLNLYAGQTIPVGTVTVGLVDAPSDYEGQLYVTYATTDNWVMAETHLYVGEAEGIPRTNKKNPNPKIGRFDYKEDHNPMVDSYTYYLGDFASFYTESNSDNYPDGFVVAAHAAVYLTDGSGNIIQEETAWAKWGTVDYSDIEVCPRFSDSRWGWYNYYAPDETELDLSEVLYAAEYINDSLNIYLISVETGLTTLISSQAVPADAGTQIDGLAWNPETNMFFFTAYPQGELWNQELGDITPYTLGDLLGDAATGTFYNGYYYYVDDATNAIYEVTFDESFQFITGVSDNPYLSLDITGLDEIESISFSPDGAYIYIVGMNDQGEQEVIRYNVENDDFITLLTSANLDLQIAVGSAGNLYGVDGLGGLFAINSENGDIEMLFELDIEFNDLSGGPLEEGGDIDSSESEEEE